MPFHRRRFWLCFISVFSLLIIVATAPRVAPTRAQERRSPGLTLSSFLGGSGEEEILCIVSDKAGNLYMSGETSSPNLPVTKGSLPHPDSAFQSKDGTLAFVAKLDPTASKILYLTYLGGSKTSVAHSLAVDASGSVYVTGRTEGGDFPLKNPLQSKFGGGSDDAFLAKLNPQGTALVYSTLIGGSKYDEGRSVAVDAAGNAYVAGHTESDDFPTRNPLQAAPGGGQDDLFVVKMNAAGTAMVYSTFLGGNGSDVGHAIAADSKGNAFVTGQTNSTNFPLASPFQSKREGDGNDAFVLKLNPAGSKLEYSTYVGGRKSDESRAIFVDAAGSAYVAGYTQSPDFPTARALQAKYGGGQNDAFVFKLNPSGLALEFSTFFGGSGGDFGRAMTVDSAGNIYLGGYTDSKDFPAKDQFQPNYGGGTADAFVAKIAAGGAALIYSSYVGGSAYERGRAMAIPKAGGVILTGRTESKDFPSRGPLQLGFGGGPNDAFMVRIR